MSLFVPDFEGELELESLPEDFVARLSQRVATGFIVARQPSRYPHHIVDPGRDSVTIRSGDGTSMTNFGGKEISISRQSARVLSYRVSFPGWRLFSAILVLPIAMPLGMFYFCIPALQRAVDSHPLGVAAFFGFAVLAAVGEAWLLATTLRGTTRTSLEKILRETLVPNALATGVDRAA